MDTDELIRRLAKLRDLTPSLIELPGRLDVGEEELSEVISKAIERGLVHLWEATLPSLLLNLKRPKSRAQWEERAARKKSPPPFVVLSSLAAFRLDIVIDLAGERWIKRGTIEKEFDRSTSTIQEAEGAAPFWLAIADHRPGPDSGALTTPWAITDRVSTPRVLLGQREPWPVPEPSRGVCGVCRGRPLDRAEYCLVCDRAGCEPRKAAAEEAPEPEKVAGITGGGVGPRRHEPAEAPPPPGKPQLWRMIDHEGAAGRRKSRSSR